MTEFAGYVWRPQDVLPAQIQNLYPQIVVRQPRGNNEQGWTGQHLGLLEQQLPVAVGKVAVAHDQGNRALTERAQSVFHRTHLLDRPMAVRQDGPEIALIRLNGADRQDALQRRGFVERLQQGSPGGDF